MGKYTKREFQLGEWYVAKRKGSQAYYRVRGVGGRIERISLGTADFEQAKQNLTDWFVANQKIDAAPSEVSIAQILLRYVEGREFARKATVKGHVNRWLDFFEAKSVQEATTFASQEAFKTHLLGLGLSPCTVNHIVSTGRAALRMAWKKGEIPSAPPLTMLPVGDQEPMGEPLSIEQARKLLSEMDGHLWLLNVLLIGTVARPSALMQLEWSQVSFESGLIQLNPPGRKQNKKRRPVVKMPPFLRKILDAQKGEGPVVSYGGKAVKSVKTAFRKARTRAGLEGNVTLYSWRHTLSRWMRAKGVPAWEVQGQLGHRTAGVTERYAEYAPDFQSKAVKAIEEFYRTVTGQVKRRPVGKSLKTRCRVRDLNPRPTVYKPQP